MTSEQLAITAGILLSLAFNYIPGLNDWYQALEGTYKRLIMLLALVLVAAGAFGLSCWKVYPNPIVTCDVPGAWGLVQALFMSLVANQTTYLISPKPAKFAD